MCILNVTKKAPIAAPSFDFNFADLIAAAGFSVAQKQNFKKNGFVVFVDEDKLYFEQFAAKVKELGLSYEKTEYNLGDFVVVGLDGKDDIIRLEKKPTGKFPIYSLRNDFYKIVGELKKYKAANKKEEDFDIVNALLAIAVSVEETPEEELPVTIFNTFVKVGMCYCKLNTTPCGIRYFSYDGENYRIRTNIFGINSIEKF